MDRLSDDLLCEIMSWVGSKDYYSMSQVCREWRALAPCTLREIKNIDCWNEKFVSIMIPPTLVNLERIDCSKNKLTEFVIPPTLVNLKYIYCSNNKLTELMIPDTFVNLIGLSYSTGMEVKYL